MIISSICPLCPTTNSLWYVPYRPLITEAAPQRDYPRCRLFNALRCVVHYDIALARNTERFAGPRVEGGETTPGKAGLRSVSKMLGSSEVRMSNRISRLGQGL